MANREGIVMRSMCRWDLGGMHITLERAVGTIWRFKEGSASSLHARAVYHDQSIDSQIGMSPLSSVDFPDSAPRQR